MHVGEIGFFSEHFITNESAGTLNIAFGVVSGKLCGEVAVSFSTFDLNTTSDSGEGVSYCRLQSCEFTLISLFLAAELDYFVVTTMWQMLSFERPNATISISIVNDVLPESAESFEIHLMFPESTPTMITLNPSIATVEILDDDITGELRYWVNI